MAAFSSFYPYLEPWVSNAGTPAMQQALRSAAIDFCERSNIINTTTTLSLQPGVPELSLDVPSQSRLVRVMKAMYRDRPLEIVATQDVGVVQAFGLDSPRTGPPTAVYLQDPEVGDLLVYPVPETAETDILVIRASFAPTRTATSLPDVLFQNHLDTIVAGAAARLAAIPDRPFSSTTVAALQLGLYERAVVQASRLAQRGRVVTSRRVSGRSLSI